MALKFKKPEVKESRLKFLVYGEMGSGKSTMCCAFPTTAYIDTEDTTSKIKYSQALIDNGGGVINTGDMDEIINQVRELLTCAHNFKTVVIDSLTVAYENLIIEAEKRVGSEFGRHIAEADKKVKQLINLLLRLDMNVIVTCQARKEYGNKMQVVGQTYAGYKRLGYMFDLVLETSVLGRNFSAIVRKSRLAQFETGEDIKFSYAEILKRCGPGAIEKEVETEAKASPEKVAELMHLIEVLGVQPDIIEKWLVIGKCDAFEDMPVVTLDKCIQKLKDKINLKQESK